MIGYLRRCKSKIEWNHLPGLDNLEMCYAPCIYSKCPKCLDIFYIQVSKYYKFIYKPSSFSTIFILEVNGNTDDEHRLKPL